MTLSLPRFEHELDAGDLHEDLRGMKIVMVINPNFPLWEDPFLSIDNKTERMRSRANAPWESSSLFYRSKRYRRIVVPENLTDDGRGETIEIEGDSKALWDLEIREDFTPLITQWADVQWETNRLEWLEEARKN